MSMLCAIRYEIVNTVIIAMYGVINYLLLMPKLVAFYAKLNEIQNKNEFRFALEVSFSIYWLYRS